jgi:endoglucanase
MYVILNIHHEDWIRERFPTDSAECMKKYTRIWEQISARFKDYDDYLMFESMNEEGQWNDVWYIWGDNANDQGAKARAYGLLNAINQKFADIVRESGGNNEVRHLLLAGYDTNIDRTSDPMFKIPTECANRCAVSVHYYDPFSFTHSDGSGSFDGWANPPLMEWGTDAHISSLNTEMNKLKTNFVNKNIPVIVGEYGYATNNKSTWVRQQSEIRKYTLAVTKAIYERDMLGVLWDIQLKAEDGEALFYYDRKVPGFVDQTLVEGFRAIIGAENPISSSSGGSSSGSSSDGSNPSSSSNVSNSSSSSSDGETPIRLPQIASGQIQVKTTSNSIVLENLPSNAKIEAYNLQGKRIYSANSENSQILQILVQTKGIYFVKIENKILRIPVM